MIGSIDAEQVFGGLVTVPVPVSQGVEMVRKLILRSLLIFDSSSQGKRDLQAWKRGIRWVQRFRIARLVWNSRLGPEAK